jgi:hypothetical protein
VALSRIIVIEEGATNFNFDEHIHVTHSNPLFWTTIVVHEGSNFYLTIISLSIFMWHEVEYNIVLEKGATKFNFDEHIHVTPSNPLLWATIDVHEGSNFYFPIINLPIFMWHEVK